MREIFENPFSSFQIQEAFEKQRDKVVFELKECVKDKEGKAHCFEVIGRKIDPRNIDIWNDDYIVSFRYSTSDSGRSHAKNRFESVEKLKEEMFFAFGLTEPAQISLF